MLNTLFGKEMGKVKKYSCAENCRLYYYKLKNEKYISIIDIPGISDDIFLNDRYEREHFYFELIIKLIKFLSETGIQVKGIIFLVNFQIQRFDCIEQEVLFSLNKYFPFKSFWKQILVIFSHCYIAPDDPDIDKIDENIRSIFSNIMIKLKDVSDVIDYKKIKIKYFNSYFPVRNERQEKNNNIIRNELEEELNKFILMKPLFFKIAIDFNKIIYLDLEGKAIANIENIKNYSTDISTKNNKNCYSF